MLKLLVLLCMSYKEICSVVWKLIMAAVSPDYNYLPLFTDYQYGSNGQRWSQAGGTGWRVGMGCCRRSYVGQRK